MSGGKKRAQNLARGESIAHIPRQNRGLALEARVAGARRPRRRPSQSPARYTVRFEFKHRWGYFFIDALDLGFFGVQRAGLLLLVLSYGVEVAEEFGATFALGVALLTFLDGPLALPPQYAAVPPPSTSFFPSLILFFPLFKFLNHDRTKTCGNETNTFIKSQQKF